MKIKKNYDMLKKIKHSKDGITTKEKFLEVLFKTFPLHIYAFISLSFGVKLFVMTKEIFFALMKVIEFSLIYFGTYGLSYLYSNKYREIIKFKSEIELQALVNELSDLEVKTSVELLQEAKINQINYKIKYEDNDKIPRLVEYKYIDVPLVSGYEETLLQEHKYGDKDYELSVNSPVKKMNYKVSKSNI